MIPKVFQVVFVSADQNVPPPEIGQHVMADNMELVISSVTELEERAEDGNRRYDVELTRVLQ